MEPNASNILSLLGHGDRCWSWLWMGAWFIGYVGAGCGVGFSVGITLIGFGIGLPANCLFEVPYNAFLATRSGAMEIARSSGLLDMRNVTIDGWSNIGLQITGLKGKAGGRSTSFKHEQSLDKRVDLTNVKSAMSSHSMSDLDCSEKFKSCFFHPPKGMLTATTANDHCFRDGSNKGP